MSTSSIRGEPPTDARKPVDPFRLLPPEIAGAVNLLAHPLAGAAAFSALGIGLASHAFGVWMGAVSGAVQLSERLLSSISDGMTSDPKSFRGQRGSAEGRAASAARALIADAHSAARASGDVAAGLSSDAPALAGVRPAGRGAEAVSAGEGLQPQAMERPAAPDDLKAISGIGPKLERVLNGLGIWTFAQIAGWEKAEIAWVNRHLSFSGRIERDDWTAQARTLMASAGRH